METNNIIEMVALIISSLAAVTTTTLLIREKRKQKKKEEISKKEIKKIVEKEFKNIKEYHADFIKKELEEKPKYYRRPIFDFQTNLFNGSKIIKNKKNENVETKKEYLEYIKELRTELELKIEINNLLNQHLE